MARHLPIIMRTNTNKRLLLIAGILFPICILASPSRSQDPYPEFEPQSYNSTTVVENLYEHATNRLRLGYYEETLVAALETENEFDGKLSPRDQAQLEELVAKCLLLNNADLSRARELFFHSYTLRTKHSLHDDQAHEYDNIREGFPSSIRLLLWAGECALAEGQPNIAKGLFESARKHGDELFESSFEQQLATYDKNHRTNAYAWGTPTFESAFSQRGSFSSDIQLWSRLILGHLACSDAPSSLLRDLDKQNYVGKLISANYIERQAAFRSEYAEGTVGPSPLNYFLNLAIHYAEAQTEKQHSISLANSIIQQLENDYLGMFFVQTAKLHRLVISVEGSVSEEKRELLLGLMARGARLGEFRIYPIVVSAFINGGDTTGTASAAITGKNLATRQFSSSIKQLRDSDPLAFSEFRKSFDGWIDSRIRLGYAHPESIRRWDSIVESLAIIENGAPLTPSLPHLNPQSVAIEYIRFPNFRFDEASGWSENGFRYNALVTDADNHTSVIELGEASSIDRQVAAIRQPLTTIGDDPSRAGLLNANLESAIAELSELVISPLFANSGAAAKATTWIIGLDGNLQVAPFFALNTPSGELGLTKTLVHVNSIANWKEKAWDGSHLNCLLVGDPSYGSMIDGNTSTSSMPPSRSLDLGDIYFPDLKGTGEEVDQLEAFFRDNSIRHLKLKKDDASEANLRVQIPARNLLHLATHGYFTPPNPSAAIESGISVSDGLFRSSVVFSGANTALEQSRRNHFFPSENDGFMMAAEFIPIDMNHIKIMSLSACETALGDTTGGEGISGLQRGLAVSGVQNMLLSLWQISDEVTPRLMADFYQGINDGTPPHTSLANAQRELYRHYRNEEHGTLLANYFTSGFRLVTNTLHEGAPLSAESAPTSVSPPREKPTSLWVIACEAETSEATAEKHAARWRSLGLPADKLWIPDYESLSGANYWLTFVGPWDYALGKDEPARILQSKVLPQYPSAYGIRVDQTPKRETFK